MKSIIRQLITVEMTPIMERGEIRPAAFKYLQFSSELDWFYLFL
jgi:hypothetical protein